MTAPRPRWLRWLRRLALAAAGLVVLALLAGGVMHWRSRQRMQDLLARIAAADPRWTLADLEADRRTPPDDRNAATLLLAFGKQHGFRLFTTVADDEAFNDLGTSNRLNDIQRATLAKAFTSGDVRRRAARELADFPVGRFPLTIPANPINALLPHVQTVREMASFLRYDLYDLADRGDRDEAVRAWRAMWNCNRALGDEPFLITMLVRVAIRAIAYIQLERLLAQGEWTDYQLAALQTELEADADIDLLRLAFRGERAVSDETVVYLLDHPQELAATLSMNGPWSSPSQADRVAGLLAYIPGVLAGQREGNLRNLDDLVAITRLPEAERYQALAEWDAANKRQMGLPRLFAPAASKMGDATRRDAAMLRVTTSAVACERYRLRAGRFPTTLDEVVAAKLLAAVPNDPYDAKPLKLARHGSRLVVYTVGHDGIDNGGYVDRTRYMQPGIDYGVTLWMPASRRQPAMPPPPPEPTTDGPGGGPPP